MRATSLQHRSVGIAVIGSRRRLLVHRRADDKDLWPGRWDLAAGGVVGCRRDLRRCGARELAEELGIGGAPIWRS